MEKPSTSFFRLLSPRTQRSSIRYQGECTCRVETTQREHILVKFWWFLTGKGASKNSFPEKKKTDVFAATISRKLRLVELDTTYDAEGSPVSKSVYEITVDPGESQLSTLI